jgi:predicted TIM-barrel fold metal-dependent hydrolase
MLLDINAYVGHWPFKQLQNNTCKTLLECMNRFGVEISVISNLNGVFYKDTHAANEELFEEIRSDKRFEHRFIPFAVLNPIYAGWQNDLEICHKKLGMKGVCLYPLYHDYEITDPACVELAKNASDLGMIIKFVHRIVDSRQRSWMDISREFSLKDIMPVIKEVPDAKYFVANAANSLIVNEEDTNLLKKTDILFDTSGRVLSDLGEMIKRYGKDKFAFGTHSPVLDYLAGLLRIESLYESESDEATKELLKSGNAKRILGL